MTTNNKTTFDFQDGKGSVPAHTHSNGGGWIANTAYVEDTAYVGINARVYGNAQVSGKAKIYGNVQIFDNAKFFGNTYIFGNSKVSEKAQVYGNARVYDNTEISGNAIICQDMYIQFRKVNSDLVDKANIKQNIFCQTGLTCKNNYVICYKKVNENLTSLHDPNFQYVIGEWAEVENPDMSNESCTSSLHFSHETYWGIGKVLLECKVILDDIITVQEGKIRVKKCFVN